MFRRTLLISRGEIARRKNYPAKLMPKILYYNLLMIKYMRYCTQ